MDFPKLSIAIVSLGLTACGVGVAASPNGSAGKTPGCKLLAQERNGALVLKAHAHGAAGMNGHYKLDLDRQTPVGSATIRQGGDFTLSVHGAADLTELQLSNPKEPFAATLTVLMGDTSYICARAGL